MGPRPDAGRVMLGAGILEAAAVGPGRTAVPVNQVGWLDQFLVGNLALLSTTQKACLRYTGGVMQIKLQVISLEQRCHNQCIRYGMSS